MIAAIFRRREIIGPRGSHDAQDVVVRLDRVSADEVVAEALKVGSVAEAEMSVPETEQYLGAAVVALRAPART